MSTIKKASMLAPAMYGAGSSPVRRNPYLGTGIGLHTPGQFTEFNAAHFLRNLNRLGFKKPMGNPLGTITGEMAHQRQQTAQPSKLYNSVRTGL